MDPHLAAALAQLRNDLCERLDGFGERLDGFGKRLDGFGERLESLSTHLGERLDNLSERMDGFGDRLAAMELQMKVEAAKAANSRAGFQDKLIAVPLPNGAMPTPGSFPSTLGVLVVGGSELAPNTANVSSWSRHDSLNAILQYEPDYKSDTESGSSYSDDIKAARSTRRRRLHLAKLIGVTPAQMALVAQASFAMA